MRDAWMLCVLALGACDPSPTEAPSATDPGRAATGHGGGCAIGERAWVNAPGAGGPTRYVRGPGGLRLLGSSSWVEGPRQGPLPAFLAGGDEVPLAWSGARYLALAAGRLTSLDQAFGDPLPLRVGLPATACLPGLLEMGDRVLLYFVHPCAPDDPAGDLKVLVLGPGGVAVGANVVLQDGEGQLTAPPLGAVHARWDVGHAVLTEVTPDGQGVRRSWVLDPAGTVLARQRAERVACPRSGCVRVHEVNELSGSSLDLPSSARLRIDPLRAGGTGFTTNVHAAGVQALSVSGDRLLVVHEPDSVGANLTVIGIARRAVLAQLAEPPPVDPARLRPTPRGFVLAGLDPERGLYTRTIDCAE